MKTIVAALLIALCIAPAHAAEPIKIGWMYSYTYAPNLMKPALDGAQLAVKEFNEAGGLKGRNVELIVRDDHGDPAKGVRIASELLEKEKVEIMAAMSTATVAKSVYEYTERKKIAYFSTWCSSDVCVKKNPGYTFSFEEPYEDSAKILAWEAAKYPIKKWAIVRNTDDWSMQISKPFIDELKRLRPDVELVTEIAVPYGKVQGGVIAQTLKAKGTEGVYVTVVGSDMSNYLRALKQRKESDTYRHMHAYLMPEELNVFGEEAPKNWYILGYPENDLNTKEHLAFLKKYKSAYKANGGMSGLLSYVATQFMLESMKKAGSTDADAVAKAAETITIQTPVGPMAMKEGNVADFTYWYGTTDVKDGKPILKNYKRGNEIEAPKGE